MLLVRAMPMQSQQEVQAALQYAIELEHATIPPYLTALYSLQPGKNQAIAALLKGIVFEEMQHMTLAANMLNAVGGQPLVNDPKFIPQYPGGLPFHIGDRHGQQFDVPLKAFSLSVVENVFMRIEEPDDPIVFPAGTPLSTLAALQFQTIGDFYRSVRASLKAEWFTGDHARQVKGIVKPVYTLADAQASIDLIVEQGEGTTTSPWLELNSRTTTASPKSSISEPLLPIQASRRGIPIRASQSRLMRPASCRSSRARSQTSIRRAPCSGSRPTPSTNYIPTCCAPCTPRLMVNPTISTPPSG